MFSGKILLIQFTIIFQVTVSFNGIFVDNVVNYCENKVNRFTATEEEKYVKKDDSQSGEPSLFGELFPEIQKPLYEIEHTQRVFECMGNILNEYPVQNMYSSYRYQHLVQTCISKKPWTPQCDPFYPYRTINGTCNNLYKSTLGSTLDCSRRLFPANYEGTSRLRKSVNGKRHLPTPRSVSLNVVKNMKKASKTFSALFIVFGQAVAHDLTQYFFSTINVTGVIDCCKYANTRDQHPQCVPLIFKSSDTFYAKQGITCLPIARQSPCHTCSTDKRIPINAVTSFIDCSLTYGVFDGRSTELRRNDGSGKLKSHYVRTEELLPAIYTRPGECQRKVDVIQHLCMKSGDNRMNQHAMLTMIQTVLLREHNRIADEMKLLNPHWSEEKLFQESRKILIAEFQIIIYKEFLPILLGPNLMSKYRLYLGSGGSYDFTVDPSISVEFNAAAFRIHTLIPGKFVEDEDFTYLKDLYINLTPLYTNKTSSYFSKMSNQSAEEYDWYMPTDVTQWLYKVKGGTYGYDLAALDIQRGRDVGLPTYSQIIEYMEKRPGTITEFSHLKKYLAPDCQKYVKETYEDVRDIDFWIGLNCENITDNMIISTTAAEIIAEQFRRLKFGDRFYVEHDVTLTPAQRLTLLKASLSKMICDNTYVEAIQPMAMLLRSTRNSEVPCSDIPEVDLKFWKEWR